MIESKYLKENIENIQRLMSIQALKHFETRNLGKLLRLSKIRQYDDGEIIIQEGDLDPWLYFLLSGKIRISKGGEEIGIITRKGEIFGEMRIIDDQSRSASVNAIGKTVCLAVDTSAGNRLNTSDEKEARLDFLLLLYRIFAEYIAIRLRLTNEELVKAKRNAKKGGDSKKSADLSADVEVEGGMPEIDETLEDLKQKAKDLNEKTETPRRYIEKY